MIRILIADPHETMRRRLTMVLECVGGLRVDGQAGNLDDLLFRVEESEIDVLVLDPSLSAWDDAMLVERIRSAAPDLRILVLSKRSDEGYRSRLMDAGADAYLSKTSDPQHLVSVIRMVGSAGWRGVRTYLPSLAFG
jgi:DNA-binding NarL/FixJ family response regulator